MKSQSSLERMLIISAVIIVATISLIFIYYGFNQIVKSQSTNYISNIYFSNIYYVNNTMLITTKNNASIGNDVSAYLNVTFINGTKSTYDIEYKLTSTYVTQDNEKIYEFNTQSFNLNLKNTSYLKIGLVFVKTNGISLEPEYNSTNRVTYYPLNAFSTLEAYTLNVTTSGGGIVSPNTTRYYYSGTKVVLNATPLENYSFVGWDGYGLGNYTGPNSTDVIKIGGNIREIAEFEPKIPIYFNSTYPNIPFEVGFKNYTTNTTVALAQNQQYKYSFSKYYNSSTGVRYSLLSVSGCGYSGNNQTITVTRNLSHCQIFANYVKQYNLMMYSNDSNSGSVYPENDTWYESGSSVQIIATPKNGYAFSNWVGSGSGNYTGNNDSSTIVMNSPIKETAYFVPMEFVYVSSNKQITFKYDGHTYQTNRSIEVPQNSEFSLYNPNYDTNIPGYYYSSEVSRYPLTINSTGTTCALSGTTFTAANTSSSANHSCTIELEEQPTPQYALIFNESLNGGTETPNLNYGSIYFSNGTQAQHINWIDANTIVSFYAGNNNAGYGFKTFTDEAGTSYDGYTLIGYSGTDGVATTPYPASANNYEPIGGFFGGYGWDCGDYVVYTSEITDTIQNNAEINMTAPAIENANYISTSNITEGNVNIKIHYVYYNLSFTAQGSSNCDSFSEGLSSRVLSEENITYNVSQVASYSNYTSGIGNYTLYNILSQSDSYGGGSASLSYSSDIDIFKNSQFLSPEFTSIYQNINNYMNSKFPYSIEPFQDGSPRYENVVSYWYNLSGITVYSNYIEGTPSYSLQIYSYSTSGSVSVNENLQISSTP